MVKEQTPTHHIGLVDRPLTRGQEPWVLALNLTWSKFVPCLVSVPSSEQRDGELSPCRGLCLLIVPLLRGPEMMWE